jgi:hypothetical protein
MAGIGHNSRARVTSSDAEQAIRAKMRTDCIRDDSTYMHRARWEIWLSRLSPKAKLVGLAIWEHADHDGTNAFPSMQRLLTMVGGSKRDLVTSINEFSRWEFVEKIDGKGRRSNEYRFAVPEQTLIELSSMVPQNGSGTTVVPEKMVPQDRCSTTGVPQAMVPQQNCGTTMVPQASNSEMFHGTTEVLQTNSLNSVVVPNQPVVVPNQPVVVPSHITTRAEDLIDLKDLKGIYTSTALAVDATRCEINSRSSHQVCQPAEPENNQLAIQLADSQQVSSGSKPNGSANHEQPHKSKRGHGGIPDEYPKDFQEFWKVYPRRVGKAAAFKAWQRLKLDQKRRAYVALKRQLSDLLAMLNDQRGNFCPHPATWINQGRFDDEAPGRQFSEGEPHFRGVPKSSVLIYLQRYAAGKMRWEGNIRRDLGPAPNEPGCEIPKDWIEEAAKLEAA